LIFDLFDLVCQQLDDLVGIGRTFWYAIGALYLRSEEHTSELQSRFGISYAVFCLKKKDSIEY